MNGDIILTPVSLEVLIDKIREALRQDRVIELKELTGEKLLSPAEACKLFVPEITKLTLSNWSKQGLIPKSQIGGRIFYKYSDVIEAGKTLKKYKRV